ncbi:MAG: SurA N-terminal domain-containing protein [Rickettsiales bacterium]|nr:SurA N-terminal domain-containing protein [Rickettsiales bacterium]
MLNTLRSSAHGLVAKILLSLLCLSFVIWGIDDVITNPDRNKTLARVGGTSITTDQFLRSLHSETENIRRLMGDNYSPEALKNLHVEGYVLQNLISRRLLQLESQDLGLIPGDVDVVRRIRSNPSFQDSKGNFDKAIFEAMLRNINQTEKSYVDSLREDMSINLLLDTLASGIPQSDFAAPTLLHAREEGRQITLYTLTDSVVPAIAAPTDEELQDYYDTHPAEFTAAERRTFSYVTLTHENLGAKAAPSEADLRAAYQERIEDYKRPERRGVMQLLYSSEAQANKAYDLVKSGKALPAVAAQIEPLNKNAIAMGKVERHNIFDNAADEVFSLKEGETTGPIQSPFGWHIFNVTSIEPPSTASFEEVRPALEKDMQQRHGDEALTELANKVEDALAGGASLAEAAQEFKLKLATVGPVTAQGLDASGKKAALPDLDKILETAFKTEENGQSPVMTSKGGTYYLLSVDKLEAEHIRPLAEMRDAAVKAWQKKERATKLAELAKQAGEEFAGSNNARAALIAKYKMQALGKSTIKRASHAANNVPLPPQLVGDVFGRKLGEGTGAYMNGEGAYLVAVADASVPITAPEKDPKLSASLADIKRNLKAVKQNEILDEYTQYLRGKFPVTVYDDVLRAVNG